MSEKTPIEPDDIRKGDKVIAAAHGMETTFVVDHIDSGRFYAVSDNADHDSEAFLNGHTNDWFLLERPETFVSVPQSAIDALRERNKREGEIGSSVESAYDQYRDVLTFLAAVDGAR